LYFQKQIKNEQNMIHTVHLDNKHVSGRKLLKEIHRYKQGASFENPANSNVTPEGYMTVEEFRTEAKISLTKLLNEHGIC